MNIPIWMIEIQSILISWLNFCGFVDILIGIAGAHDLWDQLNLESCNVYITRYHNLDIELFNLQLCSVVISSVAVTMNHESNFISSFISNFNDCNLFYMLRFYIKIQIGHRNSFDGTIAVLGLLFISFYFWSGNV